MNRFGVSAEYTRSPQSGLMGLWNRNVGWRRHGNLLVWTSPKRFVVQYFHVLKNEER